METGRAVASVAVRRASRADAPRSRSAPRRNPTPVRAASPYRVGSVNVDDYGLALLKKVEADLKALADAEAKALITLQQLEVDRNAAFGAYMNGRPRTCCCCCYCFGFMIGRASLLHSLTGHTSLRHLSV